MEDVDCCRRSFAASIKDTAARLLQDPSVAPRAVITERMNTCRICDKFNATTQICDVCLCFLPLKTTMANAACPIGKWVEFKK